MPWSVQGLGWFQEYLLFQTPVGIVGDCCDFSSRIELEFHLLASDQHFSSPTPRSLQLYQGRPTLEYSPLQLEIRASCGIAYHSIPSSDIYGKLPLGLGNPLGCVGLCHIEYIACPWLVAYSWLLALCALFCGSPWSSFHLVDADGVTFGIPFFQEELLFVHSFPLSSCPFSFLQGKVWVRLKTLGE